MLVLCAVDVGSFVSSLEQLEARSSRSSLIQQLRQVTLMHSEPSLGCVPLSLFLMHVANTESYVTLMSTFNTLPCSLWSQTLDMGSNA